MNKKDNFAEDFNSDEKRDEGPLRIKETKAADDKHGAYRPRMNHIFRDEQED